MHGFIAALAEQGPTRGPQHVFVNRRIVKDRTIAHAIIDAYSVASIKERSPEVHLFLEMPPDAVDVNVHPTKAEVRFREQSLVHEVVRRALDGRARAGRRAGAAAAAGDAVVPQPVRRRIPGVLARRHVSEPVAAGGAAVARPSGSSAGDAGRRRRRRRRRSRRRRTVAGIRPMIPLGQFRDTFIIAMDDEGIAIIDQHVAHERVLFERVMERLTSRAARVAAAAGAAGARAAAGRAAGARRPRTRELARLGFEVEEFGRRRIKVTAVPALLETEDSANGAARAGRGSRGPRSRAPTSQDALKRIAATTACHAAVKANYPLTYEKMTHILDELRATAYSTVCPHGRPVMLRLTRREIEKNFERI